MDIGYFVRRAGARQGRQGKQQGSHTAKYAKAKKSEYFHGKRRYFVDRQNRCSVV
jgi:hypothetical protein